MTKEEIIASLEEQAKDKDCFAEEQPDGFGDIFAQDAKALREAANLLRPLCRLDLPLTLEELREMDGEPVWITPGGFWALVIARRGERVRLINHEGEIVWADKEIELVGPVYRRKPKEPANA